MIAGRYLNVFLLLIFLVDPCVSLFRPNRPNGGMCVDVEAYFSVPNDYDGVSDERNEFYHVGDLDSSSSESIKIAENLKNSSSSESIKIAENLKNQKNSSSSDSVKTAENLKNSSSSESIKIAENLKNLKISSSSESIKIAENLKNLKNSSSSESVKIAENLKNQKNSSSSESIKIAENLKNSSSSESVKIAENLKNSSSSDSVKIAENLKNSSSSESIKIAENLKNSSSSESIKIAENLKNQKNSSSSENLKSAQNATRSSDVIKLPSELSNKETGDCEEGWKLFIRPKGKWCMKLFYENSITQPVAENRCQAHGATLSGLQNQIEAQFVLSSVITHIYPDSGSIWIGLKRRQECLKNAGNANCTLGAAFEWTDNSATGQDGINWNCNQPDNARGGNQNCVIVTASYKSNINSFQTGLLDDVDCDFDFIKMKRKERDIKSFVCGKVPKK